MRIKFLKTIKRAEVPRESHHPLRLRWAAKWLKLLGRMPDAKLAQKMGVIQRWREKVGLTTISGTFHFGGMPQEMARKNIRLFAEKVMPFLANDEL